MELKPGLHQEADDLSMVRPLVSQVNNLRRRKAVHRQAAGADAADELPVIVRPQIGVEAALEEQTPLPPWSLSSWSLGGQSSQART